MGGGACGSASCSSGGACCCCRYACRGSKRGQVAAASLARKREREIFDEPLPFFECTRTRTCGPPRQGGVVAVNGAWPRQHTCTRMYTCARMLRRRGDFVGGRPACRAGLDTYYCLEYDTAERSPVRGKKGRGQPALALLSSRPCAR